MQLQKFLINVGKYEYHACRQNLLTIGSQHHDCTDMSSAWDILDVGLHDVSGVGPIPILSNMKIKQNDLGQLLTLLYLLTPSSRVLLEKLTGSQLVKKFPALYGTPRFITTFTSAFHLYVS